MSICTDLQSVIENILEPVLKLRDTKKMKTDGSYVSEGDLLMERHIEQYVQRKGQDYFLISEEKDNRDFSFERHEYAVVVDPIDGTENFVSGLKEWGVGVSVYRRGQHVESMVALPELGLYLKTGDEFPKFQSRLYGLSSSLSRSDILALEQGYEYRISGCCMYNMYNVITGAFAFYRNPKGANCWDILPGLNLALENNCEVIVENEKYAGEFLPPDRKYRFQVKN